MTGYRGLAGHYSLLFPLNDRQRGFFGSLLEGGRAESVLDVGSGTGEHLSWFSARGLAGFALEPDEGMVRRLREREWPGPAPAIIPGGMEELPAALGGRRVDLVLCLGNTLPHAPDLEAAAAVLKGMAACLAPGGRLVLQTVNYDRILREGRATFPPLVRELPGGGTVTFRREYVFGRPDGRLLFRTALETPDGAVAAEWPLLPLVRDEIAAGLAAAGLSPEGEYGDYDLSWRLPDSPALILVARREPERPGLRG